MLRDINKNTVDLLITMMPMNENLLFWLSSFSKSLVNGATGIAVGMATNIPPHNLKPLMLLNSVMDNPGSYDQRLNEVLPGPDFPTGALVMGKSGIHKAYETGKGSIRSRTEIEETKTGRERIVVD